MKEIWKDIKEYEGYYQISNLGNVRSLDRIVEQVCGKDKTRTQKNLYKGKILKTHVINSGYVVVDLCKNHKSKKYLVHRLVGNAFLEKNKNNSQINHKDENKLNNCVENLEWCTPLYNSTYLDKHKKVALKISNIVLQFDLNNNFIASYVGSNHASSLTNVPSRGIRKSCNSGKPYKGFIWKYEKKEK